MNIRPAARFLPDPFILVLLSAVLLASLLPARGEVHLAFIWLTNSVIALMFFMHGAKLSRQEVVAGMTQWRLHLVILCCTFVLFPLLGLAIRPIAVPLVGNEIYLGILYMCAVPATVQSAIAFTALARGNVAAAVCSATASNMAGIVLTPLLVLWMIGAAGEQAGSTMHAMEKIVFQLLLPFVAGQLARRWISGWVLRHQSWLKYIDQVSILLVVYTAFSQAVNDGLWHRLPLSQLAALFGLCCVILATVLTLIWGLGRIFAFEMPERITLLFGGSKKSLATGATMAQVLFGPNVIGTMLIPILLFHQLQLMVCAVLARRFSENAKSQPVANEKSH